MKKNSIQKIFDLSNKTVILTGSAGRLGTQFANILSEAGANLVLIDIDEKKNKQLEKSIQKKFHTKTLTFNVDISNKSSLQNVKKDILKKFGKIDILINNAFFNPSINQTSKTINFETFPLDLWNKVIGVNLTGVFFVVKNLEQLWLNKKVGL